MIRSASAALLGALVLIGCTDPPPTDEFAARIGNSVLTTEEVGELLDAVGPGLLDSTEAADRIVEQWVTNELLYREGLRRGLRDKETVRRQLEEGERSVIVAALLSDLYADAELQPTEAEINAYFEENRSRLKLLEPYVRLRFLAITDVDSVDVVAGQLAATDTTDVAAWNRLIDRWAEDPDASRDLARSYVPQSRIFSQLPSVQDAIERARPGRVQSVALADSSVFLVQVLDRVPAGTEPRLEWIRESLQQRLAIETRKQLYARLVQSLRNEALAGEDLELR